MQIKASMLEAIALVEHHAGLPIGLGSGSVQVAPIGLPGHMPRQTNAVLAHRMQCAALSIPDANHPGAICTVQCMSRPYCLSSHEVHLVCAFIVYMQATCPDRLAQCLPHAACSPPISQLRVTQGPSALQHASAETSSSELK